MTLVPWLWICSSIEARAPEPRAIMAITERHADDDAEHGEGGAHLVAADGA